MVILQSPVGSCKSRDLISAVDLHSPVPGSGSAHLGPCPNICCVGGRVVTPQEVCLDLAWLPWEVLVSHLPRKRL